MKIVINKCFGGFSVSEEVYEELGIESEDYDKFRENKNLIEAIEKIGEKKSSGSLAELRIVEIPDDVEWEIDDYDGMESIHETHRVWR